MRDALKRIAREAERREPERAAGLLSEHRMRELSNGPSACAAKRREPFEFALLANCHEWQLAAQTRRRQDADWRRTKDVPAAPRASLATARAQ